MIETVRNTLARVESVKDRVFLSPMTEDDLVSLEREAGLAIPSCLREYLRFVGLRQDLTRFGTSDDEVFEQVFERAEDFRLCRDFLTEHFGDAASPLFPFAHDGAGNYLAVAQGKDCCPLFFADHETLKIEELGTFCDWLAKVVEAALKVELPSNTEKEWRVQFSFCVADHHPILEALQRFGHAHLGPWTHKGVTDVGVASGEAPLTFGSRQLKLMRSEYHGWTEPMFAFDYDEPATVPTELSTIRKLDIAFRAPDLGYKLVDYGVVVQRFEQPVAGDEL
jgi:SMI1/KNR4 family protein SUKH-1